jgi:hypothetical protein
MDQSYKDLVAWQKAMQLVTEVYMATGAFPKEEIFGLTSQLRRAVVSIPCNIAEGQGRLTKGEFLLIREGRSSKGDAIIVAGNLNCLTSNIICWFIEVGKILNGFWFDFRELLGTNNWQLQL